MYDSMLWPATVLGWSASKQGAAHCDKNCAAMGDLESVREFVRLLEVAMAAAWSALVFFAVSGIHQVSESE
jgi:hypothetical protein